MQPFSTAFFILWMFNSIYYRGQVVYRSLKKNEFHLGKNGMQEPCYPKLVLEFRNMEYGDYETLKIWEKFNKREYPYIKIHYLAPDMCAKSTEIYTKPQVSFIQFEQDDYKVDDIKKYTLVMQYETISNNESNN